MLTPAIIEAAHALVHELSAQGKNLATVESCTGGQVGTAITAISGSSSVYPGGVVTYSNELKHKLVSVQESTLEAHGAVSSQTAIEMAKGGQAALGSDYAIAITGIAGPTGGTDVKPVGTVWICVAGPNQLDCRRFVFVGNRGVVRSGSVYSALIMVRQQLAGELATLPHEQEQITG